MNRRPLSHTLALALGAWLVLLGVPAVVYYALLAINKLFQ